MKHFLITRVALKIKPNYMDGFEFRKKLFNEICVPSVEKQTCKDFERILMFDNDVPSEIYEQFIGIGTIITTDMAHRKYDLAEYIEHQSTGERYILTTRLDADDEIVEDFIEKTQEYFETGGDKQILSRCTGAEVDYKTGIKYGFEKQYTNPFITLKEYPDNIQTVYVSGHGKMEGLYSCEFKFTKKPMRYRILHGLNLDRKEVMHSLMKEKNILD